jgi:hypothetical protein
MTWGEFWLFLAVAEMAVIITQLSILTKKVRRYMSEISDKADAVLATVTGLHGKVESAVALIVELHELIGNPGDPVVMEKLEQARVLAATDTDTLGAAITANDPTP